MKKDKTIKISYFDLRRIKTSLLNEAKSFDKVRMKSIGNKYRAISKKISKITDTPHSERKKLTIVLI